MQLAKLRILQNEKKLTKWKHDVFYPYDKQSASRNSFLHETQQIQKSPTKLAFASRTWGGGQQPRCNFDCLWRDLNTTFSAKIEILIGGIRRVSWKKYTLRAFADGENVGWTLGEEDAQKIVWNSKRRWKSILKKLLF